MSDTCYFRKKMNGKDVIKCHKGGFWSEPLKRISVYEYCISPRDVDVVRHHETVLYIQVIFEKGSKRSV